MTNLKTFCVTNVSNKNLELLDIHCLCWSK